MGLSYETVVLTGEQATLLQLLENLPEEFDSLSFESYRAADRGFVIFGWHEGIRHLSATEEIEELAKALSLEFGKAIATHFDEMLQVREATLYCCGESIRSFGEWDELWAPTDCNGDAIPGAPRCPSSEIPEDADYDFVWDGIDAGLEVAGFQSWLPTDGLLQVARKEDLIWERAARQESNP